MGCNASNHPPHNNPNVRSTSYSIFRRCRRRKKNKEEQNDEYNDEELKRKIDMMSGVGGAGADDTNKDISFSHQGFNFLGNSIGKNYFKGGGAGGGNNGSGEFFEDGDQDDLNNKNSRGGAGNGGGGGGGSGIFVNVPLLAQSQASSSQLDFFQMLDQKIQEGPDYQTPSSSCCSSDVELDEGDSGAWTKMRSGNNELSSSSKSCTKNHNHHHHHNHHHYQLLHHEAKNRWKPFLSSASVDKPPPGYNAVNCIIETSRSSTKAASGGAPMMMIASGTTPSSSPLLAGGGGAGGISSGGIINRTNIIPGGGGVGITGGGAIGRGSASHSNNNLGNATVFSNNSALKDFYMNDRGLRSNASPHLPHRNSQC